VRERPTASDECAGASKAISLRLDSELSPVQEVLLEAHLARCADCRARSEAVVGLTDAIRSAPLVEPSTRFQLPAPSGARTRLVRMIPAAAAVAAVVLSGLLSLHLTATRGSTASIGNIRHVMGFKEQMLEQLDTVKAPEQAIRPSLAEQATLGRAHVGPVTSRRR
jgi:predicted anti-sigma-YlaC factor YlaD